MPTETEDVAGASVYVVMKEYDYEGGSYLGVFATEESAVAFVREHEKNELTSSNEGHRPSSKLLRFDFGSCHIDIIEDEVNP